MNFIIHAKINSFMRYLFWTKAIICVIKCSITNKSTNAIYLTFECHLLPLSPLDLCGFRFWDKLPYIRYYTIIILYYSLALLLLLSLLSNHEPKA